MCVDGVGSPAQSSSSREMTVSLHLLLPRRPWENVQWKHSSPIHKTNKAVSPDIEKKALRLILFPIILS